MSKYSPFSSPSNLDFDTTAIFGIALERANELSKEKVGSTFSLSNTRANNLDTKSESPKCEINFSYDQLYPKTLPSISECRSSGMPHHNKDALGNIRLNEEYRVKFKETGEIISAMIPVIKYESKCEVVFHHSNDKRCFTLFGMKQSINNAKQLIESIINKINCSGKEFPDCLESMGFKTIEMVIPKKNVNMVIGIRGSTIKMLRERTHCHMLLVNDKSLENPLDKVLRISGTSFHCKQAERLVTNLISTKITSHDSNPQPVLLPGNHVNSGALLLDRNHVNFRAKPESTYKQNKRSRFRDGKYMKMNKFRNQSRIWNSPVSQHIPPDSIMTPGVTFENCMQQSILSNNFSHKDSKPEDLTQMSNHNQPSTPFINPSPAIQVQNNRSSMFDCYLSMLLKIDPSNPDCQNPNPESKNLVQNASQLLHSPYSQSSQYPEFSAGPSNNSPTFQYPQSLAGQNVEPHWSNYQQSQTEQNFQPSRELNQCVMAFHNTQPSMEWYEDTLDEEIYQSPNDEYEYFLAKQNPSHRY